MSILAGIRSRLIALVVASVLPAIGLLWYEERRLAAGLVAEELARTEALARELQRSYDGVAAGTRPLLQLVAHIAAEHGRDRAQCTALLADLLATQPSYENLWATDPGGELVCAGRPLAAALTVSAGLGFRDLASGAISEPPRVHSERRAGTPVLVSSYPSGAARGAPRAVAFAAMDLDRLGRSTRARLAPDATIEVLDRTGAVVSRTAATASCAGSELVALLRAGQARGAVVAGGPAGGEPRPCAFVQLGEAPLADGLYVVVGRSASTRLARARGAHLWTLASLAATLAAVVGIATLGGNYLVVRRLRALTAAAQRFARGERGRVELDETVGELGVLTRSFVDMTEAVAARESEVQHASELLERAFATTHILFAYLDVDLNFIRVNRAYGEADGHLPEYYVGKNHFALFPNAENEAIFRRVIETGEPFVIFAKPFTYDAHPERGISYWDWSLEPVRDAAGRICGALLALVNVTERIRAEEQVKFLAYHDELTGLANRALLVDRLTWALAEGGREGRQVAVVRLDLDRFAYFNELLGHTNGDAVLRAAGERIAAAVRHGDTVARLAGDEFALGLLGVDGAEEVERLMQHLADGLGLALRIEGQELFLSASMGIAVFPEDGADAERLLENAGSALHGAKSAGGNARRFYSAQMGALAAERLELEAGLRRALDRGELLLQYQPQVSLRTGRVSGVEALVRWRHPEKGLVPPARFIPLAEETGLIVPLGEWVLRAACEQARAWREAGTAPLQIAVNLSARQFREPGLEALIRGVLAASALAPAQLELELTESVLAEDPEGAAEVLDRLERLGVQVAIDDFGTGFSSLARLQRFPVDRLKIDRTFVAGLTSDPDAAAIVLAIVGMAHALGIETIAEGVETAEQLAALRRDGCDAIQGFYFSPPLDAAEVPELLRANRTLALT